MMQSCEGHMLGTCSGTEAELQRVYDDHHSQLDRCRRELQEVGVSHSG